MARRASKPKRPEPPPTGVLDWTDRRHWDYRGGPKPCRYCDRPTQLRDSDRKPAHKVCAEEALAEQAREAAAAYFRTARSS